MTNEMRQTWLFVAGLVVGFLGGWLLEKQLNGQQAQREARLREQLARVEAQIRRLQAAGPETKKEATPQMAMPPKKDDLKKVKGIGPVFASRLNEANVYTFAELAALTPDHVREIISPQNRQTAELKAWIVQAKEFAQE